MAVSFRSLAPKRIHEQLLPAPNLLVLIFNLLNKKQFLRNLHELCISPTPFLEAEVDYCLVTGSE